MSLLTFTIDIQHFDPRFQVPKTEAVNAKTEAVNAFIADWGKLNNWWCPPVGLTPDLSDMPEKQK